jgi:hypothetical protein
VLLICDPEVKQVLRMTDCIEAMEWAFAEEARGIAVHRPRVRYKVPPDLDKPGYMANIIAGAVPSLDVAALRYTLILNWHPEPGKYLTMPSASVRSAGDAFRLAGHASQRCDDAIRIRNSGVRPSFDPPKRCTSIRTA